MAMENLESLSFASERFTLPENLETALHSDHSELTAIFGEVELCDQHREDIEHLGATLTSDGFIMTHTTKLASLHTDLNRPGIFKTVSPGTNPDVPNCFAYPIEGGGWNLIRYNRGTPEAECWDQTVNGWTRCQFGVPVSLSNALQHAAAIETDNGWFLGDNDSMQRFCDALAIEHVPAGQAYDVKRAKKKKKFVVSCKAIEGEMPPKGWAPEGKKWVRVIDDLTPLANTDFLARVYKRDNDKATEFAYFDDDGIFRFGDKDEFRRSLISRGLSPEPLLNHAVTNPWTFDNTPFAGEYPGGKRVHGYYAAQLAATPSTDPVTLDDCPTFAAIFQQVGRGLDDAVKADKWCHDAGIHCGRDYLLTWAASLFQNPSQPLPFLGIVGDQEGGKSALHESLLMCMTKGVAEIDEALRSPTGFNASMEGCVLAVIEETKVGQSGTAYDRLKKWINSIYITIRKMHTDGYSVRNYCHWIQTTNNLDALPVFKDCTRVMAWHVDAIPKDQQIPRHELDRRRQEELPAFLGLMMQWKLPESNHRLYLPVLRTKTFEEALHDPIKDTLAAFAGQEVHINDIFAAVGSEKTTASLGRKLPSYGCKPGRRSHWIVPSDYATSA